jgi:hypothetical protein
MVDSLPDEELNRRVIMPAKAVIPQPVLPLANIVCTQHPIAPQPPDCNGPQLDTI